MIKHIKKYKKYENIYNIKLFEVKISIIITFILFICDLTILSLYENFFYMKEFLISFLSDVIFSGVGLIGFLLSALSIVMGMINKDIKLQLNKLYNPSEAEDRLNFLVYDFIFIALVISAEIIISFFILLFLNTNLPLVSKSIFNIISLLLCYLFFFILFSCISLIRECYLIFKLMIKLDQISGYEEIALIEYQKTKEEFKKEAKKATYEDKKYYIENINVAFLIYILKNIEGDKKKIFLNIFKEIEDINENVFEDIVNEYK